jgi:class 3 adenylate cyclase/predicted ATPase
VGDRAFVTVVGLPGIGKSRLVRAVMDRLTDTGHALYVVQVASTIAHDPSDDAPDIERDAVVVVDVARVSTDDARAVAAALSGLDVAVIAEADAPFGLPGERVVALAPLPASDGIEFFVSCVRVSTPSFEVTAANSESIAQIVGYLDGHPLALEIAAARVATLSLSDLARRLDHQLGLVMDTPSPTGASVSLRAAIEWSCELLDPFERALLGVLSVFQHAWSADVAERASVEIGLHGDALHALGVLAARGLVSIDATSGRGHIAATVRDHARARLLAAGLAGIARDWHLAWTLQRLEDRDDGASDLAEIDSAFEWAIALADPEAASRLVFAMVPRWTRSHSNRAGLEVARRALDITTATSDRARLLLVCSGFELAGKEHERAAASADLALQLSVESADRRGAAYAQCAAARVARAVGDLSRARALLEAADATLRELDDVAGLAASMRELGLLSSAEGDFDVARTLLEEGLASLDRAGALDAAIHARGRSVLLAELGRAHALAGDATRAAAFLDEALQVVIAHDNVPGTLETIAFVAQLAAQSGMFDDAARLLGAITADVPHDVEPLRQALRLRLGDQELATHCDDGAHMSIEAATAVAFDVVRRCGSESESSVRRMRKAFLFTDIVGSTELVERLGDDAWAATLRQHDSVLRTCFVRHRGTEVKSTGDGFLVVFDDVDDALACACAVQRELQLRRNEAATVPGVRVGVHSAEAFMLRSDFAGRGVHLAARIAGAAGAGEIMVSAETGRMLGAEAAARLGPEIQLDLKGIATPVAACGVRWNE